MARFAPGLVAGTSGNTTISLSSTGVLRDIFGSGQFAVFLGDGQFEVPQNVTAIRVRVLGAGGGGAVVNGAGMRCTGGGGGGFSMGEYEVVPGTIFPVTVGKGGAYISNGIASAGGSSSFGVLLSATGGAAGQTGGTNNPAASAAGGTGVGGTINNATGGASGAIGAGNESCATGGGGAASQFGNGGNSGNISGGSARAATGGGAVRGMGSNDVTSTVYAHTVSGGGGTASSTIDANGGFGMFGERAEGTSIAGPDNPTDHVSRFIGEFLFGGGGSAGESTAGNGGPGAGGGASRLLMGGRAGDGGIFGGGGAGWLSNSGSGGNGGFGGGGGGAAGVNGYAGGGSKGGDGLVIVEW